MSGKCFAAMACMLPVTRDEDVAFLGGLDHRHHAEAVHRGLEAADRVDLADDHLRAHAGGAGGDAAAAPAVAGHDDGLCRRAACRSRE